MQLPQEPAPSAKGSDVAPNVYTNSTLGVSVTKPAGWSFAPTEWQRANLDNLQLENQALRKLLATYSTEPVVIITKYHETSDKLNPVFKILFRPLGPNADLAPEEILEMQLPLMRDAFDDFEVIEKPAAIEASGLPGARMTVAFTVEDVHERDFLTRTRQWIVKRGDAAFIMAASGPPQGEDESTEEFEEIFRSVVIEPVPLFH